MSYKDWFVEHVYYISSKSAVALFCCDSKHSFIATISSMKKKRECPLCLGWKYIDAYDHRYQGRGADVIPITIRLKLKWRCGMCHCIFREYPLTYVRSDKVCFGCFKMKGIEPTDNTAICTDISEKSPPTSTSTSTSISISTRRKLLEAKITSNHERYKVDILLEKTIKDAHIYSVIHNIPSQTYGILIQNFIIEKGGFSKNRVKDCNGDCSKGGKNYEIKVSLGGKNHNKFNFVQILRSTHKVDYYILTAYHLSESNIDKCGELYIFLVPANKLKDIVGKFGGFAHGTTGKLGKISKADISIREAEGVHLEYALRPTFRSKCWNVMLPYWVTESYLYSFLSE